MQSKFLVPCLAAWATAAQATPLTIHNQCDESVALYDNSVTETIASGGSTTRTLSSGFSGMFRNGISGQATLAEFSITGGYTWYDISIIPTGTSGPGTCGSLEECKEVTGGTGFNTPMQIAPSGCTTVTCLEDGCADAYQYPSDDGKTHSCVDTASVTLTFCPGGSSSTSTTVATAAASTPTPTTAAPPPNPTTAAPTPTSTTAAPTPTPITAAPTPTPTTAVPTPVPTTQAPAIQAPTSATPTSAPTSAPTTQAPTTQAPTMAPVTQAPTTTAPTTQPPTTEAPPYHGSCDPDTRYRCTYYRLSN
ncbi:unnamed protein product [Phytophthora fragariaefolia]|uniref:Unnamed protein product n=1 Tax=Phytophthora fragariaefolia TaxID=1490495 RepID=A0A9W6U7I0_9STRA|nr:unnamed protein product [Phytophthora fragariaefolia]